MPSDPEGGGMGAGVGMTGLVAAVSLSAVLAMALRPETVRPGTIGPLAAVHPANAYGSAQGLTVQATQGAALWVADGVRSTMARQNIGPFHTVPRPDEAYTDHLVSEPSAVQWRPPASGQPSAHVLTATQVDEVGRAGPVRMHTTLYTDHGRLPVVSLLLAEGALYDPDTGIHVVGHAVMHPTARMTELFEGDGRWWKYPGNYQFRGQPWERHAQVQIIAADGSEIAQMPTGVRIHGNITRSFPQKAFRLVLHEPLAVDLFGDGPGHRVLLLRAAGNDQPKAMMRDPLMQRLCDGMPLLVTRSTPCVLYVNGAYWGLYHLQQRIDEKEIARRTGVASKQIEMVELEYDLVLGKEAEAARFKSLVQRVGQWNGSDTTTLAAIDAAMDLNGFIAYMAALLMAGNQDWPFHNVKVWRYTGRPHTHGPLDGRWNFILGDTDLALGAHAAANEDLFAVVQQNERWPVGMIFLALMRSPQWKARFHAQLATWQQGPLAAGRILAHLDSLQVLMAPEMERHTARWRRPANADQWHAHVQTIRSYVSARDRTITEWLQANDPH